MMDAPVIVRGLERHEKDPPNAHGRLAQLFYNVPACEPGCRPEAHRGGGGRPLLHARENVIIVALPFATRRWRVEQRRRRRGESERTNESGPSGRRRDVRREGPVRHRGPVDEGDPRSSPNRGATGQSALPRRPRGWRRSPMPHVGVRTPRRDNHRIYQCERWQKILSTNN